MPHTTLVSIGDREADLFELFALARDPASPRLLVRANRGRQRQVMSAEGLTPLWDHLGGLGGGAPRPWYCRAAAREPRAPRSWRCAVGR
ncbi:MAG: hypothetical protein IPN92_01775 [Chromatiaceae bacterium]|nr:hypothetical protein [Chromatiaceae bacterium]